MKKTVYIIHGFENEKDFYAYMDGSNDCLPCDYKIEAIDPDEFDQSVGNPQAIIVGDEIVSFAAPFSFREGETEIGAVATAPDQRNKGYCKALISEMAFRILGSGKAVTLTTEKTNLSMRAAAKAIGMKEL